MNILVGCEESQAVTVELRKLGHNAYSNDIIDCSGPHPEWHLKMDIFEAVKLKDWDMGIFFPPCTYLCSSGLHWNKRVPGRAEKTDDAIKFVEALLNLPIRQIALENPIGCISSKIRKPDQIVQPWQFGEDASKSTCLWLKNLPKLVTTNEFPPRIAGGKKRWGNQTDSGQNKLGPSDERALLRSKTYQGIAEQMALQWAGVCK